VYNTEGRKYWQMKSDVSNGAIQLVDWEAIGRAMRTVKRKQRVFISKYVSGMWGVGKFMLNGNMTYAPVAAEDTAHV
jgi:hypothetical protein